MPARAMKSTKLAVVAEGALAAADAHDEAATELVDAGPKERELDLFAATIEAIDRAAQACGRTNRQPDSRVEVDEAGQFVDPGAVARALGA